jgi:hypothetical protein
VTIAFGLDLQYSGALALGREFVWLHSAAFSPLRRYNLSTCQ